MVKKKQHKYLILLYTRVDNFLNSDSRNKDNLPDIIVSFCTVVEKLLKIKLHKKNPVLAFDIAFLKTDDVISIISLKKESDVKTAKIESVVARSQIVFKTIFTSDELQALRDIYEIRNMHIHGYKADEEIMYDAEDIIKKMGTLWEKIPKIAGSLLGKGTIRDGKPKKKYSEEELKKVLESEVKEMIKTSYPGGYHNLLMPGAGVSSNPYVNGFCLSSSGDVCPRCGQSSLYLGEATNQVWGVNTTSLSSVFSMIGPSSGNPNLYKCRNCGLELTEKQYEIAKRL